MLASVNKLEIKISKIEPDPINLKITNHDSIKNNHYKLLATHALLEKRLSKLYNIVGNNHYYRMYRPNSILGVTIMEATHLINRFILKCKNNENEFDKDLIKR